MSGLYQVVQYTHGGQFRAVISGLGRNRGTWDSCHSRRTARRHAKRLRAEHPGFAYRVETVH